MRIRMAVCVALGALAAAGCSKSDKARNDCGGKIVDLATDPLHCGSCGNACATPLHATAVCARETCGRTPCEAGWFDFDGAETPGCEASCAGTTCTLRPGGAIVILASPPLPETGLVGRAFASGSSGGSEIQTSATYTNVGTLGEATPPGAGGTTIQQNANHRHQGGFNALHR